MHPLDLVKTFPQRNIGIISVITTYKVLRLHQFFREKRNSRNFKQLIRIEKHFAH